MVSMLAFSVAPGCVTTMRVPSPGPALRFDGAAIGFDQRLGDGQPKPIAAGIAGARSVAAMEALEDVRQLRGRDARAAGRRLRRSRVPIVGLQR